MTVEQLATWVALVGTISGAAIGYGTLTEKVANLESTTDATHLESRLTKLETRIEDNDVRHIGKDIEILRGANERLSDRVSAIRIPSVSKIKADIQSLQTDVKLLQNRVDRIKEQINEAKKNPLG